MTRRLDKLVRFLNWVTPYLVVLTGGLAAGYGELNGPLVWTKDEHGATHEWPASALRPLEPVSYREHARVVAERDRLRRELEAWRDNAMNHALTGDLYAALSVADRLDAILSGGGS